jgi:hypothetical protein
MTFPPSHSSFPPTAFHPEPLLAVACPTCFGAIAAGSELLGHPAECPLCGQGFLLPVAGVADAPRQPPAASPAAASPAADAPAADAPAAELQFQEPVRTVVSGDQVITLRRLTSEEKALRRTRRNIVMMLAGVSILMAIVRLFGTKRPKRRD